MNRHLDDRSLELLAAWIEKRTRRIVGRLSVSQIAGGRSNLTYLLSAGDGTRWVLRRPPLRGGLPSAHDVKREYQVMTALSSTPFPVPKVLGYEADISIIGAPFMISVFLDGMVIRTREDSEALSLPQRESLSIELIRNLVFLHSLNPIALGLGQFLRPQSFAVRQLRRWQGQLALQTDSGARSVPLLDEVVGWLTAHVPSEERSSLLHGDYRLDNVVVSQEGVIVGVLDWELSTVGDPVADVAMLLEYWIPASDEMASFLPTGTCADGYSTRQQILDRYQEEAGYEIEEQTLRFFQVFSTWKLAVILQGVAHRLATGSYGADAESEVRFESAVVRLAQSAASLIEEQ